MSVKDDWNANLYVMAFFKIFFCFIVPENVDIGHCLVGDSKSMEFVIDNNGGQGRFCFVLGEICDQKNNPDIAWDEVWKSNFFA